MNTIQNKLQRWWVCSTVAAIAGCCGKATHTHCKAVIMDGDRHNRCIRIHRKALEREGEGESVRGFDEGGEDRS